MYLLQWHFYDFSAYYCFITIYHTSVTQYLQTLVVMTRLWQESNRCQMLLKVKI